MLKQLLIFSILIFQTSMSYACLNTYQFKIYPVGVSNGNIVSVDVQIRRTSRAEGNRELNLGLKDNGKVEEMWILYSYISTYDKHQKLIANRPIDTTYCIDLNYTNTLNSTYLRGFKDIEERFPEIDFFNPDYISFCDFQQACNMVEIGSDTVLNEDYIIYDEQKYPVEIEKITQDKLQYRLDNGKGAYEMTDIQSLYINSVRVYKSKTMTLVINHLASGHEIIMENRETKSNPNIIVDYSNINVDYNNKQETRRKEYNPKIEFTDIRKSTYQEPVLHHGYGVDVFIVK